MSDKQSEPKSTTKLTIDWDFIDKAMPSEPSLAAQRAKVAAKRDKPEKKDKKKATLKSARVHIESKVRGVTQTSPGHFATCHQPDGTVGFPAKEVPLVVDPAASVEDLEIKAALMKLRIEPYRADAIDGDGDGIVQEHTAWERPVGTRLLDKAGKEIAHGLTATHRPADMRIVDSAGKDVHYTPTYMPKTPHSIPGVISRAPHLGPTIGEKPMTARQVATNLTPEVPNEWDMIEGVDMWLTGTTKPLRAYIEDILGGPETMDAAHKRAMGGMDIPAMDLAFKLKYVRQRRAMAGLMNLIADGEVYDHPDKPLWRGYYLQMPTADVLKKWKAGSKHDFPVRSFSEARTTASGFLEQRRDQSPGGTSVLFKLTGPVKTASLHEWGMETRRRLREDGVPSDLTPDERIGFPFSRDGFEFLSGEEEHLVMGTFEVVDVHWDEKEHMVVVEVKEVAALGRPEGGGGWR